MQNVIVSHTFDTEQQARMQGYLTHALCLDGEANMELNASPLPPASTLAAAGKAKPKDKYQGTKYHF